MIYREHHTGIIAAIAAIVMILAVSLTACSSGEEQAEGGGNPKDEKTWLWGQQEMKAELTKDTPVTAMSLVGRSVLPLPSETEEGEYGNSICCVGEHCYFLARPLYTDGETCYELHIFDGDTKEWTRIQADLSRYDTFSLYRLGSRHLQF